MAMGRAVTDKRYHSDDTLQALAEAEVRTYVSEPDRGRHRWQDTLAARQAVSGNRRRIGGERAKSCGGVGSCWHVASHAYETGGMRRVFLRGRNNVLSRVLIRLGALHLSLVMRQLLGKEHRVAGSAGLRTTCGLGCSSGWGFLVRTVEEAAPPPMLVPLAGTFHFLSEQSKEPTSATDCQESRGHVVAKN